MTKLWAVLKVKTRLRRGWTAFEDTQGLHWMRRRKDTDLVAFEEEDITAEEEAVLDDVLKEEMSREDHPRT